MDRLIQARLIELMKQEMGKYVGWSPHAKIYGIYDPEQLLYVITGIENNHDLLERSFIIMQAHVEGDWIVIDDDTIGEQEKQLVTALLAAGVPREQIILAYIGEKIPEKVNS